MSVCVLSTELKPPRRVGLCLTLMEAITALSFLCVVRPLHMSTGHKMDAKGARRVVVVVYVVVFPSRDLCVMFC